jgi:hypothetical protein
MTDKTVELGDRVKDPVSGLIGIATCIATWLHGCVRVVVQPEKLHEGKPIADVAFDQTQLVVVKKAVYTPSVLDVAAKPIAVTRRSAGGPSRESVGFKR